MSSDRGAPGLMTLDELYAVTEKPVEWLVEGLFQEGANAALAAAPKTGKSLTALALAHSLASGAPFLGHFATPRKRRITFLEEDDPATRVAKRLQAFEKGYGAVIDRDFIRLACKRRLRIDSEPSRMELITELKDTGTEVLILDPLNKFHLLDENHNKDMNQLVSALDEVADKTGAAIIVVHHMRKPKDGATKVTGHDLRGSSVLHAWVENSLYLNGTPTSRIAVRTESKETQEQEFLIVGDPIGDDCVLLTYSGSVTGDTRSDKARGLMMRALLELVRGGMFDITPAIVQERSKLQNNTVNSPLKKGEFPSAY